MRIRWSPGAAQDLSSIADYIREDNRSAAHRVVRRIYEGAGGLAKFPNLGHIGRVPGTRELPLPNLPYIVIYRVLSDTVEIVSIIHGAQRFP